MKFRKHRLPKCPCPWCGSDLNAATPIDGNEETPKEGDYSVCIECACVNAFTADGQLRRLLGEERTQALADPDVQRAQTAILGYKHR